MKVVTLKGFAGLPAYPMDRVRVEASTEGDAILAFGDRGYPMQVVMVVRQRFVRGLVSALRKEGSTLVPCYHDELISVQPGVLSGIFKGRSWAVPMSRPTAVQLADALQSFV